MSNSSIETCAEEEISSTSQYSLTRFDEPNDELPSTVEFKTDTDEDVDQLASTMEPCAESKDYDVMESKYSTASTATPFAIAQV